MAWQYHDFEEQSTDLARLARLRQHISEVGAKAGRPDVSSDGKSRQGGNTTVYRRDLMARLRELENATGTGSAASSVASSRVRRGQ